MFVPPGATPEKLALLERLGADVSVAGTISTTPRSTLAPRRDREPALLRGRSRAAPVRGVRGDRRRDLDQCASQPAAVATPVGNGALAAGRRRARRRAPAFSGSASSPARCRSWRRATMPAGPWRPGGDDDRGRPRGSRGDPARRRAPARAPLTCSRASRSGRSPKLSSRATTPASRSSRRPLSRSPRSGLPPRATAPLVLVITGRNVDAAVLERARTDPVVPRLRL